MTKASKILATVAIIIVFMLLSAVLQAGSGPGGRNPGILGIIFLIGLVVAIRAIWKKTKEDNADNTTLNKN
jgi:hypothetical protein